MTETDQPYGAMKLMEKDKDLIDQQSKTMETLFNMHKTDKLPGLVNEEIKILYNNNKIIIIYFGLYGILMYYITFF